MRILGCVLLLLLGSVAVSYVICTVGEGWGRRSKPSNGDWIERHEAGGEE